MSRRANREGSYRQRENGSWEGRVSYVDPRTEKLEPVSVYAPTKEAARRKLRKILRRIEDGLPAKDAADTVGAWLATWREGSLVASSRKRTTKSLYATLSRKHLEGGAIGAKRMDKFRPTDVEKLIIHLREQGYAPSTVRQIYTVLRQALDVAVRDGLLAANPVAKVPRPTVPRTEARYLSSAEVVKLLDASVSLRYYIAVVLLATTGLRRGEICGLAWSDIDLVKGEMTVRNTLSRIDRELVLDEVKTDRSHRQMPLHASVVTLLKAWRKQQLQERLAAGDQWVDTGMVFCTELGTMLDPRNLLRTVSTAAAKAELGKVGAHTMRHSAATAWLESGAHIRQVSDLLGHSSIAITGDIYGHPSETGARTAVDGLGTALGL